jgi:NAD(P)-dependent dehydrogenase (short-subunit alcohol dehydrogenase family)
MLTAVPCSFAPSTSHPGPFYLTQLLLPLLISTAQVRPDRQARIVNLTSSVHHLVESLDFNTFQDGPERRSRAGSSFLYCQSKFVGVRMDFMSLNPPLKTMQANILFSNELSRRYRDQGIISTAVNPGLCFRCLSHQTWPIFILGNFATKLQQPQSDSKLTPMVVSLRFNSKL